MDKDQGVLEYGFHRVLIGDEVRGNVTAVELHTFDILGLEFQTFGLFNGDDAVFTNLLHGLGDDAADGHVIVG